MISSSNLPLDIVQSIVDEIDSQKTLYALAFVNHAFHTASIRRIWRRIDNFYILARCMDAGIWEERETVTNRGSRQIIERKIYMSSGHNIDDHRLLGSRFLHYAACVQDICLSKEKLVIDMDNEWEWMPLLSGPNYVLAIDQTVMATWLRCLLPNVLFPSLRALTFPFALSGQFHPVYHQFIECLDKRTLLSLAVTVSSRKEFHSSDWEQVLSPWTNESLNLRHLVLDRPYNPSNPLEDVLWFCPRDILTLPTRLRSLEIALPSLPNLISLSTCANLPEEILRQVATFPHLELLRCRLPEEAVTELPFSSFVSLRTLSCFSATIGDSCSFLRQIYSVNLEAVDFAVDVHTQPHDVPIFEHEVNELFEILSQHSSKASIQCISLRSVDGSIRFRGDRLSITELLHPLRDIPLLHTLSIPLVNQTLQDDDVHKLCELFPLLSYVRICETKPKLSLLAARSLLSRMLHKKALPFVLILDDSVITRSQSGSISYVVEEILIDRCEFPSHGPAGVTKILLAFFPNLQHVAFYSDNLMRYSGLGPVVTGILPSVNFGIENYQFAKGNVTPNGLLRDIHARRSRMFAPDNHRPGQALSSVRLVSQFFFYNMVTYLLYALRQLWSVTWIRYFVVWLVSCFD